MRILLVQLISLSLALGANPSPSPTSIPADTIGKRHRQRSYSRTFRSNPYHVLHVDPIKCTQKEIQQQYRKLCLRYHPDKKGPGNNNNNNNALDYDEEQDFEFKEVQHAYSLIGTEEAREKYDLLQRSDNESFATYSSSHQDAFTKYPTKRRSSRTHHNYNGWDIHHENWIFGPSSTIYFTFGKGISSTFRFIHVPSPFDMHHPHDRSDNRQSGWRSNNNNKKPHYIQRISIPLDVLYAGGCNVPLTLKTSTIERYRAAYHGGMLIPLILQSSLTVSAMWLRSQRISWPLSLFLFVFMVHVNLPAPPTKATYKVAIQRGWKGGTKIRYNTDDADITFLVQEGHCDTYTRVGNDLHTYVHVSPRQIKKGCTLLLPPICASELPIPVKLKPDAVNYGETITIPSRGWPIREGCKEGGKDEYGNLYVQICRDV